MSLESFRDAFVQQRPFAADRVSEPRLNVPDVVELHDAEFRRIIARAREVVRDGVGRGVTILGNAGVGKSHLLGRLHSWARQQEPGATSVFLHNLLVAPKRLPRYMLSTTIGVLTDGRRGDYGECALHELWAAAVRRELGLAPEASINLDRARQALARFQDQGSPLDRAVRSVLLRVGLNMHHAFLEESGVNTSVIEAGLDWLSGEHLEPEQIELLGLSKDVEVHEGLRDDQDVEAVFKVVAELSRAANRPFMLCVDQFDNLAPEQVQATTRFLHVLVDHVPNLLCILSGVTESVVELVDREVIPAANWDRVAEERVDLKFATPEQAMAILRSRVDAFHAPLGADPLLEDAVGRDSLFPLRTRTFDERVGGALSVRPRQIIRWAREEWDREAARCSSLGVAQWLAERLDEDSGGPGPGPEPDPMLWEQIVDEVVAQKRAAQYELRLQNPGGLPADASNLIEILELLLEAARGSGHHDLASVRRSDDDPARLRVKLGSGLETVICPIIANKASVSTLAVRRLLRAPSPPHHLILVEDERRPIKRTDTCVGYLQELPGVVRRFDHVNVALEAHAELDALASVFLQARAMDIEVDWGGETRALTETDVLDSLVRTGALKAAPILSTLFASGNTSGGAGGSGSNSRISLEVVEAVAPEPRALERFLLGLAAVRPWISVRNAAQAWCTEHGGWGLRGFIEPLLTQAAFRLSLRGLATCEVQQGILRVSRGRRSGFDLSILGLILGVAIASGV
jgi:hypothetical protein